MDLCCVMVEKESEGALHCGVLWCEGERHERMYVQLVVGVILCGLLFLMYRPTVNVMH